MYPPKKFLSPIFLKVREIIVLVNLFQFPKENVSIPAANFFSKIMFKKKLDFFPLKWTMVESGAKEIGGELAAIGVKLKNVFKIKKWISDNFFYLKPLLSA